MLALIPCREGSKRVPRKNFLELAGKPLWRWTYDAAEQSGVFDKAVICTDVPQEFEEVSVLHQPHPLHRDSSRDIEWVTDALQRLNGHHEFSILRVTSPFRGPEAIRRAKEQWDACKDRIDSLRAMRPTTETGWKQWVVEDYIGKCERCGEPLVPQSCGCCWLSDTSKDRDFCPKVPSTADHESQHYATMRPLTTAAAKKHLHSFPTQSLEDTYIQCGALEMAWTKTVLDQGTIAGQQVGMFLMEGPEALDINDLTDWEKAQELARNCHHQDVESLVDADTPRSPKTP